jgi:hypothetical protein
MRDAWRQFDRFAASVFPRKPRSEYCNQHEEKDAYPEDKGIEPVNFLRKV